jgi:hypothetical protein
LEERYFFANFSIAEDKYIRGPPPLISDPEFKALIYNILSSAHEAVKKEL